MTSDLELLGRFAREKSQDAFTALVNRHVNLVYSAALRQVRAAQAAEDVAQSVFADLARSADALVRGGATSSQKSLTPWLYAVTRRTAVDAIRKESRRQLREQIAVEMNEMNATANDWTQIEPLLDDALAALDETDRAAILLRYFENKTLREVGDALGTNDDAAQKRVGRAVETLREFFAKHKVTVGASGLAVLISANAVQSAPVGLATAISTAAVLTGTAVHTSTIIAVTKTIAMTTLQKIAVAAALTAAVGAGVYQAKKAADARAENQRLQAQQAPLAEEIQQLQLERDDANNRLAALIAENTELKSGQNQKELLALRGKVTLLANEVAKATKDAAKKAWNPMANMSSDPRMLEHMRVQTSRMVKRDYAKLFSDLNLPQDKADALNDLITKKHNANNDLTAKLISGNPDQSEMDKMGAETANQKMAVDEEIKQLLGADDYSKFQNYEGSLEQRSEISGPEGFAQELPAGQKLTSDQTEQLISAMAEVKQNFNFSSGAKPIGSTLGITAVAMEKPASEINMDAFTAEMQQLDDQYLARAQSILTPDQYTAFQGHLANQIQNFQMGIMMAPKTSQSGGTSR